MAARKTYYKPNDAPERNVWDIIVLKKVRSRIVFSEDVSLADAKRMYLNNEHDDVIDEEDLQIVEVLL